MRNDPAPANSPPPWVTTSTLPSGGFTGGANTYNYAGLQQISQFGAVDPAKPTDYWTNNFAWFRVMLPYMWNQINNGALDVNATNGVVVDTAALIPNVALRVDLVNAITADWGTPITPGTNLMSISPDRLAASIYKYYVSAYVLEPSGVDNPQTQTTGAFPTLLYPLDPTIVPGTDIWPSVAGGAPTPGIQNGRNTDGTTPGGQTLNAGSRGWNLSANDLARAWSGIRHGAIDGATILEDETLELMDSLALGWQHSTNGNFVGDFGQYYGHNGVNFRPTGTTAIAPAASPGIPNGASLAPMNNTVAIAFPNNVEASLLINSEIRSVDGPSNSPAVIGNAFDSSGNAFNNGTNQTLIDAYDNAWTELVYDATSLADVTSNPGVNTQDDTFIVRANGNPLYIDFVHGGVLGTTITRRIDTLERITINGIGGNNTYILQSLPETLEVLINGGNGADSVIVGGQTGGFDLGLNTPGKLTFDGSGGFNQLTISDTDNAVDATYFVNEDEVSAFGGGIYEYQDIAVLTLNTGSSDNDVFVQSTHALTNTSIIAQGGLDTITAGNANIDLIQGTVNIAGGGNTDVLRLSDVFSGSGHDYEIESDRTIVDSSVAVFYDVEDIELFAGADDDVIEVSSLDADQSLVINTGLGQNDVTIDVSSGSATVLGEVEINGSGGLTDTLTVDDDDRTSANDYTVTADTVSNANFPPIEYAQIDQLNVYGARLPGSVSAGVGSAYRIESTSTPTTVRGSILGDTFYVGSSLFGDLDGIDELLTINGRFNFSVEDVVILQDQSGSNDALLNPEQPNDGQ